MLYDLATPVKAHRRTVNLGRSKVIVDDGLQARKASHRCLAAIVERAGERVDPAAFLNTLRLGLSDHAEVQVRRR